jgi:hypothetical protein
MIFLANTYLVTPKAGAKHELLSNNSASDFSANRQGPFKSDFARELEEIEEDLKQLRNCVATNNDVADVNVKKFVDKCYGAVDSDTSGVDFIDIGRGKKGRTKLRPKPRFHGSAVNLSSDVDSLYDSSSGGQHSN